MLQIFQQPPSIKTYRGEDWKGKRIIVDDHIYVCLCSQTYAIVAGFDLWNHVLVVIYILINCVYMTRVLTMWSKYHLYYYYNCILKNAVSLMAYPNHW